MNKRIKKKIEKRLGFRKYSDYNKFFENPFNADIGPSPIEIAIREVTGLISSKIDEEIMSYLVESNHTPIPRNGADDVMTMLQTDMGVSNRELIPYYDPLIKGQRIFLVKQPTFMKNLTRKENVYESKNRKETD